MAEIISFEQKARQRKEGEELKRIKEIVEGKRLPGRWDYEELNRYLFQESAGDLGLIQEKLLKIIDLGENRLKLADHSQQEGIDFFRFVRYALRQSNLPLEEIRKVEDEVDNLLTSRS